MYYAMMRPAEVAALTKDGCHLPDHGWGRLTFADSSTAAGKAVTEAVRLLHQLSDVFALLTVGAPSRIRTYAHGSGVRLCP